MKNIFILVFLLFGSNQGMTQKVNPKTTFIPKPTGFIYVPSNNLYASLPAFYVMKEPVKTSAYKDFILWLIAQKRMSDANFCMASIPKTINPKAKYILLASPKAIELYAEYMAIKLSNAKVQVKCQLVSTQAWTQMKGPGEGKTVKNPYGILFVKGMHEWKLNESGIAETFTDAAGNKSSGFRLVLSYILK